MKLILILTILLTGCLARHDLLTSCYREGELHSQKLEAQEGKLGKVYEFRSLYGKRVSDKEVMYAIIYGEICFREVMSSD